MSASFTILRQFDFFKVLSDEDVLGLSLEASLVKAEEKSLILKLGAIPNALIFMVSGQLQSTEFSDDGRVIGIGIHNPGAMIGHLSLIDGKPSTCNLVATQVSELLILPIASAKRYIYSRPLMAEYLLKVLAQGVRALNIERAILSQPNAFHRVFMQLNQLAVKQAGDQNKNTSLPNQKEIASMVNTSRETVSRALQVLIKSGALTKSGHHIVVRKQDLLERLAVDGLDALDTVKK
jgi:CRP-like cAMP-binding protein